MKVLIGLTLLSFVCAGQGIPLGGAAAVAGTSRVTSGVTSGNTAEGQSCTSGGGESGGTSCGLSSFTIAHTGSAVYLRVAWCQFGDCHAAPPGAMTATDSCGNTYSAVVSNLQAGWSQAVLLAGNVSAASCIITLTQAANTLYYTRWLIVEAVGADAATPLDSAVSNTAHGSGTAVSISSAGNASGPGELVIADFDVTTPSNAGSCPTLQTDSSSYMELTKAPVAGASVTCSLTEISANWWATIVGIKP